jgi:SAM-dependent methyltransferase
MTTSTGTATSAVQRTTGGGDATAALVERLADATLGTLEVASVHIGHRLGLYRRLADSGASTAADLASRTGTAERYVREWLEQQATAGFLAVDDPAADAGERRFSLPDAHRPVFVDEEDLSYVAPLASLAVGVLRPLDALLDAYRTGGGVPYEAYGDDVVEGISAINRPQFAHLMAGWLQSIPQVDARLRAEPPARVADVACGTAWSSIAMARAYPGITIDALDVDEASIAAARRNVEACALSDRVHPRVHDASDPDLGGRYDLVTVFEALHDMNRPVEALRSIRSSLTEGGSLLVADERVAERFTAPGDEVERSNYGWSVLHCLAVGNLEDGSAATGTVLRPATLRTYAAEAGFGTVEVLPVEHDFWRFYRLTP